VVGVLAFWVEIENTVGMAIGKAERQVRFEDPAGLLGDRLSGVYRLLADHGGELFGDDYFADLFKPSAKGRPTIAARVMATVMLLQSHEGLSDQEAVDRLGCDLRWEAAAGVHIGFESFDPTTLVGMRNRLRASARPKRLLEDVVAVARESAVMGDRVRVVDSTPIWDAVATQDTVTQLRSAIRKVLRVLRAELKIAVRAVLERDDDYATPGKPPCDWDDAAAREELVDGLVRDALAALGALEGVELKPAEQDAVDVLAVVAGQDVEVGEDGRFRIFDGVAPDRLISTVDPEVRHGHKSRNRRFDGYKGHISIDPDSEIIEDVTVTPANVHDQDALSGLLEPLADNDDKPVVFGDCAYGSGQTRQDMVDAGFELRAKVPPAVRREGRYSKDDFTIDLAAGTVCCPAGNTAAIGFSRKGDGSGTAQFKDLCGPCPQRDRCTTSPAGRVVNIHPHEHLLQDAKAAQADPAWQAEQRATRPKVERKIAHLMFRQHGGRKARSRGAVRVLTDLVARAAAVNLARLATLDVTHVDGAWQRAGP
jgi:IS5 family transposase